MAKQKKPCFWAQDEVTGGTETFIKQILKR